MTTKYIAISASDLSAVLAGGEKTVDAIWRRTSSQSCCWYLGGFAEEKELIEAKQQGLHLWVDFQKDFRELHSLLTGKGFPSKPQEDNLLSLAMYASDTVPGTENFGYGFVRYLAPARVKEIADLFAQTTCAELAEENDFAVQEGDYMEGEFNAFKRFYLLAAKADDAILQIFV